jgi:hypothetical protein
VVATIGKIGIVVHSTKALYRLGTSIAIFELAIALPDRTNLATVLLFQKPNNFNL